MGLLAALTLPPHHSRHQTRGDSQDTSALAQPRACLTHSAVE